MLTRQHFSLRRLRDFRQLLRLRVVERAILSLPRKTTDHPRLLMSVKGVIFDPTTYASSCYRLLCDDERLEHVSTVLSEWLSEHNARFTVTGRPDDRAINYVAGRAQILKDAAAAAWAWRGSRNATSRVVEHALLSRYPDHRKVVTTIGWIQRISVASLMSYRLSADHFRQADTNTQRAVELGLREKSKR